MTQKINSLLPSIQIKQNKFNIWNSKIKVSNCKRIMKYNKKMNTCKKRSINIRMKFNPLMQIKKSYKYLFF